MRSINYHIAITLDGYICREDGSIDGFLMEGEHAEDFIKSLDSYDSVLMGRKTYEFGFQFGLKAGQPAYPNLKHYVFSESLDFNQSEAVKLVQSNTVEYVKDLKDSEGGDIWLCGGGELAGSLFENNLIEKLTLKVNPIIFGSGKKLFESSKKSGKFNLLSSREYGNGVILSKYEIEKNTYTGQRHTKNSIEK
ncbi:MAG: dihydrofolate reductase family protein [Proteobacteria bacterium]|nr:dihydrofolate reductase family protein [Pseudomonadota bacterium]